MTLRMLDRIALTPALRIAAACAALALAADLALAARMLWPRAEPVVVPLRLAPVPAIAPRPADPAAAIDGAASADPFEPLGAAPQRASADVVPQATVPAAQVRLVGTVSGARSFVVVALPEGNIKVVHVGGRAGALTLRAVSAGSAVFDDTDTGDRVTLRTPTPGAEPQP